MLKVESTQLEYVIDPSIDHDASEDGLHLGQTTFLKTAFLQTTIQKALKKSKITEPDCNTTLNEARENCHLLAQAFDSIYGPTNGNALVEQVTDIDVGSLIENVLCSQTESSNNTAIAFRMELEWEHVEWFPQRLRQILDNLISDSFRLCDDCKVESQVNVSLRRVYEGHELRITGNVSKFDSVIPGRAELKLFLPTCGGGLAVVKMLLEESDGDLSNQSAKVQGRSAIALLPHLHGWRFLESSCSQSN